MRRWLLLVMVLLLPLRAWVGDAMAAEMMGQRVAAQAQAEVHHGGHHGEAAAMVHGHDCDEHAQAQPADDTPGASATPAGDCPTCASCQACSSVALWPSVAPGSLPRIPQAAPDAPQPAYASADAGHAFKPPRG